MKFFHLATFITVACVGCAGGRMLIQAHGAKHPISSSPVVFTTTGSILQPEDQKVILHFK